MNARCDTGMTALHFAARYNHQPCVLSLRDEFGELVAESEETVASGAAKDAMDDCGKTAKDYAVSEGLPTADML